MKAVSKLQGFVLATIACVLMSVSGCALIQENESTARIVVTYATLKIVDGEPAKGERVIEIAEEVRTYTSDDPEVTVDALMNRVRGLIRWERLDRADTLLITALLVELEERLKERLGEGLISPEDRLTVRTLADWVISAAELSVSE